jgi:hypothetical protein
MIVTIHQPEHLPWLGFFDKMRQADVFVLLDTVQFSKGDFQNRNRIKAQNGATWLTIPILKKGKSKQRIIGVEISNDRDWANRCWTLIDESYKDAPHFAEHRSFFEDLYAREWSKLVDLNTVIIRYLIDALALRCQVIAASELEIHEQGGTDLLVGICGALDADVYLSGSQGRTYLDESCFAKHGIEVRYQEFRHPVYPQLWGDFLSQMSTIDLLFNCGASSLEVIEAANPPTP